MAVSLERRTGVVAFLYWLWDGVDRTIFTAIKFSFPARFVSPFGFLGMLTFVVFVMLGISGALLMFYYQPILDRAWDSVAFINDDVPFGFHIRNIHLLAPRVYCSINKSSKQWMSISRVGGKFRMKLAGDKPRMTR